MNYFFRAMALVLIVLVFNNCNQAEQSTKNENFSELDIDRIGEVAIRVAKWSLENQMDRMSYANMCTAYGILKIASATDNEELRKDVERALRPELLEGRNPHREDAAMRREHQWFGFVPLELYKQNGYPAYLERGIEMANDQYVDATDYGMPSYTPRDYVDDMYGATTMQSLAYAVTENEKHLDRAIRQVLYYSDRFMEENGLFLHSVDHAPFFWGRGNGWSAAAFAELLAVMPADHSDRKEVMSAYQKMMNGLLENQGQDGMWYQIVDDHETWPETSATAMFLFAMTEGVRNGWLPKEPYTETITKAWSSLLEYVDEEGRLREVVVGTGLSLDREYYLNRPRQIGDPHGQAPFLWASASMLNLLEK